MRPFPRLTYANVMATIAVFFSLGGSALAAKHYLITSTNQVSPKVLKKLKGATGPQGTKGDTGTAGDRGPAGIAGAGGPPGTPGADGATGMSGYEVVVGNVAAGSQTGFNVADSTATCPGSKRVVGGGFMSGANNVDVYTVYSQPDLAGTAWFVRTAKPTTTPYTTTAYAICVTVAA
jgi:hypothetical protein